MDKKTLFFLGVSIAILAVMLYFVGIDQVISALKMAKLELIGLAIAMQVFTYYLYALRWKILNNLADIDVGIKTLLPMTLVGLAINNITPSGRGGGEPVRAYILAKKGNYPMQDTFATVVADRALDTFPFVVLAALTIIAMTFYFHFSLWLLIVMILAVIAIIVILAMIIYMSINPKNKKTMIYNKKVRRYALPLSFVIWFFEIFRVYFVFLAFGAKVSPIIIGEVFIIASLVGMIPLLPGGLGAIDGIMIIFYSAAGITASISAAATVIERLISFWMATIIGLCILPYYGTSVLDKISLSSSNDESDEFHDDESND